MDNPAGKLPDATDQPPSSGSEDARSAAAREYDEGIDREGGDSESADGLLRKAFRNMAKRIAKDKNPDS